MWADLIDAICLVLSGFVNGNHFTWIVYGTKLEKDGSI